MARKSAVLGISKRAKVNALKHGAGTVLDLSGKGFTARVHGRVEGGRQSGNGVYRYVNKTSEIYWKAFHQSRSECDKKA